MEIFVRESVRMRGRVRIDVFDALGYLIDRREDHNLVTNIGINIVRDLMLGTGIDIAAIALGTGSTAPLATDTALETETFRKEMSRRTSTDKTAKFQMIMGTSEGNGNAFTEAGLMTSTTDDSGDLYARIVFGVVNKTVANQVTATWDVDLSAN